jgi:hypothetical protein
VGVEPFAFADLRLKSNSALTNGKNTDGSDRIDRSIYPIRYDCRTQKQLQLLISLLTFV